MVYGPCKLQGQANSCIQIFRLQSNSNALTPTLQLDRQFSKKKKPFLGMFIQQKFISEGNQRKFFAPQEFVYCHLKVTAWKFRTSLTR